MKEKKKRMIKEITEEKKSIIFTIYSPP